MTYEIVDVPEGCVSRRGETGRLMEAVKELPDGKAVCFVPTNKLTNIRGNIHTYSRRLGIEVRTRFIDGKLFIWRIK